MPQSGLEHDRSFLYTAYMDLCDSQAAESLHLSFSCMFCWFVQKSLVWKAKFVCFSSSIGHCVQFFVER